MKIAVVFALSWAPLNVCNVVADFDNQLMQRFDSQVLQRALHRS